MKRIKVLHLEDNRLDADLAMRELKKAKFKFTHKIVDTRDEFVEQLSEWSPDIILSDHSLPGFDSLEALSIARKQQDTVPFILITGNTSEEFAVSVIKAGADDYILKDRLQRLPSAVENAVDKFQLQKLEEAIRVEKEALERKTLEDTSRLATKLQLASQSAGLGIWEWDIEKNILLWDEAMFRIYSQTGKNFQLNYENWFQLIVEEDRQRINALLRNGMLSNEQQVFEFKILHPDRSVHHIRATVIVELNAHGEPKRAIGTQADISQEKLREQGIVDAKKFSDSIIRSIPGIFFMIDRERKILQSNAELASRLVLPPKDITGRDIHDFIPRKHRQNIDRVLDDTFMDGHVEIDIPFQSIDGRELLYHCKLIVFFVHDEQYLIANGVDVTARKQMEEELRMSEQTYKSLVESLPEGIIYETCYHSARKINSQVKNILPQEANEILSSGFPLRRWECVDGNMNKVSWEELQSLYIHPKRELKDKILGIRRGKKIQWLQINSTQILDEKKAYAQVISFFDITEKRSNQQHMSLLAKIASETTNTVIVTDKAGRITWTNEAFSNLTGYSAKEVMGKKPGDVLQGPATNAETILLMRRHLSKKMAFSVEIENYRKDGTTYWVQIHCQPFSDQIGGEQYFFSIQQDITEKKLMQEKITEITVNQQKELTKAALRAQEQERNRLGSELHDNINQILAAVRLHLGFFLQNPSSEIKIINACNENILLATDEIRRLSQKLVTRRFGEESFQKTLAKMIENFVEDEKLRFQFNDNAEKISDDLKLAIYRIIQEQLNNIVKHANASKVEIILDVKNEKVFLEVKDNGRGFILSQHREGVGITNILNRAELLNGTAGIETAPEKGCRLFVEFPLIGA